MSLYRKSSAQVRELMEKTLSEYGMSVPQIEAASSELIL
jgi:hypothetical protein